MAKQTKQSAVPVPTLKCTICQTEVTADTYATHIQSVHATPPQKPVETTQSFVNNNPAWNQGGQFGQQAPQPIQGPIIGKDLAGGKYLKGEDVPDGVNEVRFRLVQFVRDPQGRSKLAAQISETYGKVMFGFNTTNIRAVVGLGYLDMQQIAGKTIICMLGMAPNPQKNGMPTKVLFISRIEP